MSVQQPGGPQLALGVALRPRAGFDYLEPGPNAEPLAALRELALGRRGGPIYLSGAAGLGKTAAVYAALQEAQGAGRRAGYLPLRELAAATTVNQRLEGLERLDLLCVDDVEAAAGQPVLQTALFELYNRLRDTGGRWAATGSGLPAELGLALPDLVSRLRWGLVYELRPLSDEQCIGALQRQARARGLGLSAEVAHYLLRREQRDLPHLMALLDRLDGAALAAQRRLTIPFVRDCLGGAPRPG